MTGNVPFLPAGRQGRAQYQRIPPYREALPFRAESFTKEFVSEFPKKTTYSEREDWPGRSKESEREFSIFFEKKTPPGWS